VYLCTAERFVTVEMWPVWSSVVTGADQNGIKDLSSFFVCRAIVNDSLPATSTVDVIFN
jgi:hypothetical protein